MKAVVGIVVSVVMFTLGALFGVYFWTAEPAAVDAAPESGGAAGRIAELEAEVQALKAGAAAKRAGGDDGKVAEAVPADDPRESPVVPAETEEAPKKGMAALGEMMDNPVMAEMMKQQMKGQVSATFSKLFEDQGFAPDEIAALNDILVERQLALTQFGLAAMKKMAAGETPEDGGEKELEAVKKEYDEQLAALLGDEKFKEFERYEETQGERQQIDSLKASLADSDHPLSHEQEQKLMNSMWTVREDPRFEDSEVSAVMSGTRVPTDTEALITGYEAMQESVYEDAATYLQPKQLEALRDNQKSFLDMMRMGMEMSKAMMGGE